MLNRLKVRNFKALRDVDLELRERNVFIGRNNAGKSSLLHALTALTNMIGTGEVSRVFNGPQGFSQFLWKGGSETFMDFELWGDNRPLGEEKEPISFHYLIQIGLEPQQGPIVQKEELTIGPRFGTNLISVEAGIGVASRASGEVLFNNPGSRVKPFLSYEIPGWEADSIRRYISGWHFYQFMPELTKTTVSQAVAMPFLDIQGTHISGWLHMMRANHPEVFQRIVSVAKEAFPEIEAITTPVTQAGTTFLSSSEKGLRSPVSIFHASDGEIKFLQLLSIIFSPLDVGLVGVEEPESHLHPRLIELVVDAANNARVEFGESAAQVFVTTHSTFLIDRLEPEDVVVVDKVDGATHFQRASTKKDIKRMLEEGELSFGRLWYSGALGGV